MLEPAGDSSPLFKEEPTEPGVEPQALLVGNDGDTVWCDQGGQSVTEQINLTPENEEEGGESSVCPGVSQEMGVTNSDQYQNSADGVVNDPFLNKPFDIWCGGIPKDVHEQELLPIFEVCGPILGLRLLRDPRNGQSRGFGFVTYSKKEDALNAVEWVNGYEIRAGKLLSVCVSRSKVTLYIGNIPKLKAEEDLFQEFSKRAQGLQHVIVYRKPDGTKNNRGFCFLEYDSRESAYLAKKRLSNPPAKIWGCNIVVDWADRIEDPTDAIMEQMKVLYVKHIPFFVTEADLGKAFEPYGKITRVKKIKQFGFIHFESRHEAAAALSNFDLVQFGGSPIDIVWAKPPISKNKRQDILRAREERMALLLSTRPMKPAVSPAIQFKQGPAPVFTEYTEEHDYEYYGNGYSNEDEDAYVDFWDMNDHHEREYPQECFDMICEAPGSPCIGPSPVITGHLRPIRRNLLAEAYDLHQNGYADSGLGTQHKFSLIPAEPLPAFSSAPVVTQARYRTCRPGPRQRARLTRERERLRRPDVLPPPQADPTVDNIRSGSANNNLAPTLPKPSKETSEVGTITSPRGKPATSDAETNT